jgi:hypothetical protein
MPGIRIPNLPFAGAMVEFVLLATWKKNAPQKEKKSGGVNPKGRAGSTLY